MLGKNTHSSFRRVLRLCVSVGDNMTDVIAALNCIYVAEQTACEWVEALTLKKDVRARPATEMIEKVKNPEEDFRTDEEGFV